MSNVYAEYDVEGKTEGILSALEEGRLLRFFYNGFERIVEPYVFGFSSQGNALLKALVVQGVSLSGKGPGWRVFQVSAIVDMEVLDEWFTPQTRDPALSRDWIFDVRARSY